MKLWGGMFEKETDASLHDFSRSLNYDRRLYPYDLRVSRAHAQALRQAGVLTKQECDLIGRALADISDELDSGTFVFEPADEDIHSAVERSLVERLGEAGAKLRTARSRNDQVAADLRLFMKDETLAVCRLILGLLEALLDAADSCPEAPMPGFTHLQPAQPVLLAHHLLAYVEMLKRDIGRFLDARRRLDVSPLGSGALAGVTFPLDRRLIAEELGFERISANSIDAVADRDFCVEVLAASAVTAVHLSRLAEEVVLWTSAQFGFALLDDAYSTGSSLMPQKRNPDVAELARGKSGRVLGSLVSMLTVLKGLPLSYNRDLQEDKEPVFDSLDTLKGCLVVLAGAVSTMTFLPEAMREAALGGYTNATDLADYLARRGMPFLAAHDAAGKIVRRALEKDLPLSELPLAEFRSIEASIDEDVYEALRLENVLAARSLAGGTAPEQVSLQMSEARSWLKGSREQLLGSFLDSR
ncbi:MAG: argininosuccinate lyase [Candidatus Geothermincolia bacterium]